MVSLRAQAVHWALLLFLAVLFLSHYGYVRLLAACFDIRGAAAILFTQIHGIGYLLSRLAMPHALSIDPDLPVFPGGSPVLIPEALLLAALRVDPGYVRARGNLRGIAQRSNPPGSFQDGVTPPGDTTRFPPASRSRR